MVWTSLYPACLLLVSFVVVCHVVFAWLLSIYIYYTHIFHNNLPLHQSPVALPFWPEFFSVLWSQSVLGRTTMPYPSSLATTVCQNSESPIMLFWLSHFPWAWSWSMVVVECCRINLKSKYSYLWFPTYPRLTHFLLDSCLIFSPRFLWMKSDFHLLVSSNNSPKPSALTPRLPWFRWQGTEETQRLRSNRAGLQLLRRAACAGRGCRGLAPDGGCDAH